MKIVLADDSETARMFSRRCIQVAGYQQAEFIEASNGQAALEAIKAGNIDLLITDLFMPIMDGETLIKSVKADPTISKIPVLIVTSAKNAVREKELMSYGAFAVISKPVSPAAFSETLRLIFSSTQR